MVRNNERMVLMSREGDWMQRIAYTVVTLDLQQVTLRFQGQGEGAAKTMEDF